MSCWQKECIVVPVQHLLTHTHQQAFPVLQSRWGGPSSTMAIASTLGARFEFVLHLNHCSMARATFHRAVVVEVRVQSTGNGPRGCLVCSSSTAIFPNLTPSLASCISLGALHKTPLRDRQWDSPSSTARRHMSKVTSFCILRSVHLPEILQISLTVESQSCRRPASHLLDTHALKRLGTPRNLVDQPSNQNSGGMLMILQYMHVASGIATQSNACTCRRLLIACTYRTCAFPHE